MRMDAAHSWRLPLWQKTALRSSSRDPSDLVQPLRRHGRDRQPCGPRQPGPAGPGRGLDASRRGAAVVRWRADGDDRRAHRPVRAGQVRRRRAGDHRRYLVGQDQPEAGAEKFEGLRGHVAQLPGRAAGAVHPGSVRRRRPGASRTGAAGHASSAWHALFARNMFIRPPEAELAGFEPDYVILHAPHYQARAGAGRGAHIHGDRAVVRPEADRHRRDRVMPARSRSRSSPS